MLFSDKQERLYESYTLMKRTSLHAAEICVKNFSFDLPYHAPASCDMKYGQRVYYIRLTLQCKYVSDKTFKARITVRNRVDLSASIELSKVGGMRKCMATLNKSLIYNYKLTYNELLT